MCSFTISNTLKCVELALLIHCNLSSISLYSESINAGSLERKRQFAKHVSHAVHSLTIEDIRMYFEKNVGEDNSIPVGKKLFYLTPKHHIYDSLNNNT